MFTDCTMCLQAAQCVYSGHVDHEKQPAVRLEAIDQFFKKVSA